MKLLKAHHGIMKSDANADFICVWEYCKDHGLPQIEPKGKSWQKIEDATAEMLKSIPNADKKFNLHRGISYYLTLNSPQQ